MLRSLALLLLATAAGLGCGGGDDSSADTTVTTGSSTTTVDSTQQFCDAFNDVSLAADDVALLHDAYDRMLQFAPSELEGDVEEFVANSRAVSDAFRAAGAPEVEVDVAAVMASLTGEQRAFVEALARGAETGKIPANSAGRVAEYVVRTCS